MFKLTPEQEAKRQEVLEMLDICLKIMQDEELTVEEDAIAKEYFARKSKELG